MFVTDCGFKHTLKLAVEWSHLINIKLRKPNIYYYIIKNYDIYRGGLQLNTGIHERKNIENQPRDAYKNKLYYVILENITFELKKLIWFLQITYSILYQESSMNSKYNKYENVESITQDGVSESDHV